MLIENPSCVGGHMYWSVHRMYIEFHLSSFPSAETHILCFCLGTALVWLSSIERFLKRARKERCWTGNLAQGSLWRQYSSEIPYERTWKWNYDCTYKLVETRSGKSQEMSIRPKVSVDCLRSYAGESLLAASENSRHILREILPLIREAMTDEDRIWFFREVTRTWLSRSKHGHGEIQSPEWQKILLCRNTRLFKQRDLVDDAAIQLLNMVRTDG